MQHDEHNNPSFDPFGNQPTPPPYEEPIDPTSQEDGSPNEDTPHEEPQTPLYGPDFFTQRPSGGTYVPFGNGFGGGSSNNSSQANGSQGNGSYFGASYFGGNYGTPPTPPPQPKKKNTRALVGMGLGIASLALSTICCCGLGFPIAIPLGIAALIVSIMAQRKESSGAGIAGIITSALGLLFSVLFLILVLTGNVDYNFDIEGDGSINDLFIHLFH